MKVEQSFIIRIKRRGNSMGFLFMATTHNEPLLAASKKKKKKKQFLKGLSTELDAKLNVKHAQCCFNNKGGE